jgi:hypothetical protein
VEFRVTCGCGHSVPVSPGQAGGTVACRCGAAVTVPSLRELRAAAGLPAPVHPELAVRQLLQSGRMTAGPCAVCGAGADTPVACVVECERSFRKSGGGHWTVHLLVSVLAALLVHWLVLFRDRDTRVFGRDLILTLPLPLCEVCRGGLTSQAEVKKALGQVPEYQRLLEQYPHAKVRVCPESNGG